MVTEYSLYDLNPLKFVDVYSPDSGPLLINTPCMIKKNVYAAAVVPSVLNHQLSQVG